MKLSLKRIFRSEKPDSQVSKKTESTPILECDTYGQEISADFDSTSFSVRGNFPWQASVGTYNPSVKVLPDLFISDHA